MIGIVSHDDDLHAREVRSHLDALGADHVQIDTAAVPRTVQLTSHQDADGWSSSWTRTAAEAGGDEPSTTVQARDLRVMWWRRPQPFALHDEVTRAEDRGFVRGECASMIGGLWSCLEAVWVNDPDADEAASRKMWQLKIAVQLGMRVPRTCMTNTPATARAFIRAEGGAVIFKSFSATPSTWRETRPVRECDLELLEHVRFAPVIFQELIPGGRDVRVTVIGRKIFATEFRSAESAYAYDFRIDSANAPTFAHELPTDVVRRVHELMDRLNLLYGAIDLRIAPNGDYVFLEINPAGQWLFCEIVTGQPITAALAHLLHGLDVEPDPAERRSLVAALQ